MEDITTISIVAGITMALIEALRYLAGLTYKLLSKTQDKVSVDNKQETEIALISQSIRKIETNELPHLKIQLEDNAKDHQKIFITLERIETLLKERR